MTDTKSEKAILNETLVDVSALPETFVWRNNTGAAWQGREVSAKIGQTIVVKPGMKILADARSVKFGLPGSADIIGVTNAIPLAVEVKNCKGRQSEQQGNFEKAWTRAGGLYVLVKTSKEAIESIRRKLSS